MTILLVGGESAGIRTLKMLAHGEHRVIAVASPPEPAGGTLRGAAHAMGVPMWDVARLTAPGFAGAVRAARIDLLLNVHSLVLIPDDVLRAPRIGCYNLHPGPLPEYAGLNTVSWAIYRGESRYGVTVHRMDAGIDTGPIAFETRFAIGPDDTALSVYSTCIREGTDLVAALVEAAARGPDAVPRRPQELSKRRYFSGAAPDGCRVRWARPARQVANLVRACDYFPFRSPWGHPRATLDGQAVHIVKTRLTGRAVDAEPGAVRPSAGGGVDVACGDEWLTVDKVIVAGRSCPAADVLGSATGIQDG